MIFPYVSVISIYGWSMNYVEYSSRFPFKKSAWVQKLNPAPKIDGFHTKNCLISRHASVAPFPEKRQEILLVL